MHFISSCYLKILCFGGILFLGISSKATIPILEVVQEGSDISLVWNDTGENWILETSADLGLSTQWEFVDQQPVLADGFFSVPVPVGAHKQYFRLRFHESDSTGFASIPGGTFMMGNPFAAEGYSNERPVHTVGVSAFYMAKHEVTKALWDEVRVWGSGRGYTDLPAGGGKAPDHPVHSISWYSMVKWCNARSEKDGLAACYTVGAAVFRSGTSTPACDWGTNGYRLPSEAEWEKAARGGLSGQRFPWGDTISHADANFRNNSRGPYQTGTTGYHPAYAADGIVPYTSPVGSFPANGYGLFDLTGNVMERCWDWYSRVYYEFSPDGDPHGAGSGTSRVHRGCSWDDDLCRVTYRGLRRPTNSNNYVGFRLVRSSVP
ncbi:MAG: sulfatase modifying factor 1 [Verrucomicrobiales bacterium]|jgi:sulfatase modifying factor 1